ncbi:MAG: M67 family metallopeptidase [Anaerolineae bacterium]|nr:M67 family metallopeptidase [Caldilineales bacterium]MCX7851184.1 M67 family metallopeptidase [Caldilineales bacterium]MDW8268986.1 M67 family metallopeptidase [Anaerolineae bacterium]
MSAPTRSAPLQIPRAIYDAIIAHARAGKPEEVCGLLRGRDGRVTGMRRARNVAANPVTDYEVESSALLAQVQWEDEGEEMIGIYHSHPADPAYPSASDAYQAYYPDAVYLICSLQDEARPVIRGFRLREVADRADLARLRRELPFYQTRPGRFGFYLPADTPPPPGLDEVGLVPGLAHYVVYQVEGPDRVHLRVVAVEPVPLEIVE